jgi:hypothetical protein
MPLREDWKGAFLLESHLSAENREKVGDWVMRRAFVLYGIRRFLIFWVGD